MERQRGRRGGLEVDRSLHARSGRVEAELTKLTVRSKRSILRIYQRRLPHSEEGVKTTANDRQSMAQGTVSTVGWKWPISADPRTLPGSSHSRMDRDRHSKNRPRPALLNAILR